jgi:hypothetical protein
MYIKNIVFRDTTMTITPTVSLNLCTQSTALIAALKQCRERVTPELISTINALKDSILNKVEPPQAQSIYFLGQYQCLNHINTDPALNESVKESLKQVLQHLKPLVDECFQTFISQPSLVTSPKGISNQGNDCFLIALYQFLRSPGLQEHLVNRLPQNLKEILLKPDVQSRDLRQAIANDTPFGTWCKDLDPTSYSQLDPSEALLALFDTITDEPQATTATTPPESVSSPQPSPAKASPQHLNRLTKALHAVWDSIATFFSTIQAGCIHTFSAIGYFINPPDEVNGADDLQDTPPTRPLQLPLPPLRPTVITPLYFKLKSNVKFQPTPQTPQAIQNHPEFGGSEHQNTTIAHHSILEFPLPHLKKQDSYSLASLLKAFFKKEKIENKSLAVNGVTYVAKQTKQFTLETAPQHLIISFKRTGFDPLTQQSYKIQKPITGVDLTITLPKDIVEPNPHPQSTYSLKTFICHLGDASNHGHFVSYRLENDGWHFFNDSSCTPVSIEAVKLAAQTAHVVFYEKD